MNKRISLLPLLVLGSCLLVPAAASASVGHVVKTKDVNKVRFAHCGSGGKGLRPYSNAIYVQAWTSGPVDSLSRIIRNPSSGDSLARMKAYRGNLRWSYSSYLKFRDRCSMPGSAAYKQMSTRIHQRHVFVKQPLDFQVRLGNTKRVSKAYTRVEIFYGF